MKITSLGAAGGEATDACYVIQIKPAHFVAADYFKAARNRERKAPNCRPDVVLLTPEHLDQA
jgi:hypothetical protein